MKTIVVVVEFQKVSAFVVALNARQRAFSSSDDTAEIPILAKTSLSKFLVFEIES